MFTYIPKKCLDSNNDIQQQNLIDRDAVTIGTFLGIFELSSLTKLWPNSTHLWRKIAQFSLFLILLNFFEVNFDSSQLEGKSDKAVLLIANRLHEKVNTAKSETASVKDVDFVKHNTGQKTSTIELTVFLVWSLTMWLNPSNNKISKKTGACQWTIRKNLSNNFSADNFPPS